MYPKLLKMDKQSLRLAHPIMQAQKFGMICPMIKKVMFGH